jgi:N-acetylmuramoyl-L-alanine amidase
MKHITNIGSFIMNFAILASVVTIVAMEIIDREESELCMALNIYHEARSESLSGQQAVAHVTLNRVESPKYPDTVCEVVYQRKQFSWTWTLDNHTPHETRAWNRALSVATAVLADRDGPHGEDITGNAVMYHADYVSPYWIDSYDMTIKIGTHIFYAE